MFDVLENSTVMLLKTVMFNLNIVIPNIHKCTFQ